MITFVLLAIVLALIAIVLSAYVWIQTDGYREIMSEHKGMLCRHDSRIYTAENRLSDLEQSHLPFCPAGDAHKVEPADLHCRTCGHLLHFPHKG